MATDNITYSLLSLLNGKVDLDTNTQVPVSALVIPRIQRPYAQGRTDAHSAYVRNTFLDELFESLINQKECDLNFIYGIVTSKGDDYILELLDGQQRLTTLFLLYWYLACAELREGTEKYETVKGLLRKFMYETRTTSTLFCYKLIDFLFQYDKGQKPSDCLRKVKWYFKSFDRDSTVCAMLNTLDDIHTRYMNAESHQLFDALECVRFYVKSLGVFNLSEELYIKMNARGLQLSPFENFKADLVNFISHSDYPDFKRKVTLFKKGSSAEVEFDFNFSIKMDAKWVDLFWHKGSEEFDDSMMSFFSRFFACRYVVDSVSEISDREMRSDKTIAALYTNADANIGTEKYLGFKIFEQILSHHPENITLVDKVLDVLYEHDIIDKEVFKRMIPIWEKSDSVEGDDFYRNTSTKNTHTKMIALSAFISFVNHMPDFNLEYYDKWMRVVWNIIENTNIDSLQPLASLMRKFDMMAAWIGKGMKNGKGFYSTLALYAKSEASERENRAVLEEVEKARRISENSAWEDVFSKAEKHPYFKGMISFFYSPEMTIEEFSHALGNAVYMFDASGISEDFRKDHILIRAIISCLSTWNELNEQYITERAETQKYLKNLLASNENVQKMIVSVVGALDKEDLYRRLNEAIALAPMPEVWSDASDDQVWSYNHAVSLLRNNVKIYNWVSENETNNKKVFRVYWYNGHIMLAQPRKQFAKIALDTERARMAENIASEFNMNYYDYNQLAMYHDYGDMFGNDIWLYKEFGKQTLWIGFLPYHELCVRIEANSQNKAKQLAERLDEAEILEENPCTVKLLTMEHWNFERDYPKLKAFIKSLDIDSLLASLPNIQ